MITGTTVVHRSYNHPKSNYFKQGQKLEECHKVKDLGVLISNDLKVGSQCNKVSLKNNQLLRVIM